jgi:hypothetical protein
MLKIIKSQTKKTITATLNKSRKDLLKYIEEKKQTELTWQDRIFGKKIDYGAVSVSEDKIEIHQRSPDGKIAIDVIENEIGNCQFICEINPLSRLFLIELFFGLFFLVFFTYTALRLTTDSQIYLWVLFTWLVVLLTLWLIYWYNKWRAISYVKKLFAELGATFKM